MNIDLAKHCLAGINKSMRCVGRHDSDVAGFRFARFIADRDFRVAFQHKDHLHVRVRM